MNVKIAAASSPHPDPRNWVLVWAEAAFLLIVAMLLRAAGLGEGALHDELYHFLAARGLLEHGELLIAVAGEPYDRAALFTTVVAAFMELFGRNLAVARIPALLAGSLLAVLVFLWLRLCGQRAAAWIAGLLIAVDPLLIQLSQVVRFYSLQHLAFAAGTLGIYLLVFYGRSIGVKTMILIGTTGALSLAFAMQPVSAFGLAGAGLFAAVGLYCYRIRHFSLRGQIGIGLSTALMAGLAVAFFYSTGILEHYVSLLTYADLWAAQSVDNPRFYYAILHRDYAPLWTLFPLLLIFSAVRRPGLTALCATIFAVGFVGLSLAAWKAERYFSFLMPMFFIVAALGLVQGLGFLYGYIRLLLSSAAPFCRRYHGLLAAVAIAVILGFAMAGNYGFLTTARLLTRDHGLSFPLMGPNDGTLSWRRAAEKLKPVVNEVDVVVASDDLKALYYLDCVDYVQSPNSLHRRSGRLPELTPDRYTRAGIFASKQALSAIMQCHESGLFVVQAMSLGQSATGLPRLEATRLLDQKARKIDLPEKWGLIAYRWQTPSENLSGNCPPGPLPEKSGPNNIKQADANE